MVVSSVLLKTSTVLALPPTDLTGEQGSLSCGLRWRRKRIWVRKKKRRGVVLPALNNETWLQNCLQRSAVKEVWLDRKLEKSTILTWATIAQRVNKEVWMRIPGAVREANPQNLLLAGLDWLAGVVLFLLVSPGLVLLMLLLRVMKEGAVFEQQWCVNSSGRLFQQLTFVTVGTGFGTWLRQGGLNRLPQLWNVVKGETRLVGFRPLPLDEALQLN
jgi:hypothetical protein